MAIERADVIDYIKNMTVLELSELVKELEEVLGVSAAAPTAVAVAGPAAAAEVEEQTEFTVELIDFGDKKIQAIKAVREALGLGLKEAKEFVENLPATVKDGLPKDEADALKAKFEAVGASASVK